MSHNYRKDKLARIAQGAAAAFLLVGGLAACSGPGTGPSAGLASTAATTPEGYFESLKNAYRGVNFADVRAQTFDRLYDSLLQLSDDKEVSLNGVTVGGIHSYLIANRSSYLNTVAGYRNLGDYFDKMGFQPQNLSAADFASDVRGLGSMLSGKSEGLELDDGQPASPQAAAPQPEGPGSKVGVWYITPWHFSKWPCRVLDGATTAGYWAAGIAPLAAASHWVAPYAGWTATALGAVAGTASLAEYLSCAHLKTEPNPAPAAPSPGND